MKTRIETRKLETGIENSRFAIRNSATAPAACRSVSLAAQIACWVWPTLLASAAFAQSGPTYSITSSVIAGGGGTSTSATYSVTGTAGQHDAGDPAGPTYSVLGGFWTPAATTGGGAPDALEACGNDFELASNGAGGERLSRFGCVAAPPPPVAAAGPGTAIRVVLKTMYNTTAGDPPDGANVCSTVGRTRPSLSQFEGETRWLGVPSALIDDAVPLPPDYIAAPLVCTGSTAAVRDWSPSGLAASFPGADDTRIYFYGSEIVPCSVYEVSHCGDPLDESSCSEPLLVLTSKPGDSWPPFAPATGQPSFTDIGATVNKFKSFPFTPGDPPTGGPPEWHALVRGNVVAGYDTSTVRKVDFIDIGKTVDAFKQFAYNEQGPCDAGGTDNCGNACSTAP